MAQLQTTAVTGSLTVTGQIIAQTLNVQQVTSSIVYSSGSNRFGNLVTDVQQFTGSLRVTGSGAHYIVGGSVGIGTSNPNTQLYVSSPAVGSIPALGSPSSHLAIGNLSSYGTMIGTLGTGVGYIQQQRFDGTATGYNLLLQPNAGNVGIGTSSPAAKLQVASGSGTTMLVGRSAGNSSIKAGADANGGYLSLDSNGTATIINHYVSDNVWLVTGGGSVGINTTTPSAKLHIADSANPIIRINRNTTLADGNHIGYNEFYGNTVNYGYIGMWVETASTNASQFRVYTGTGGTVSEKIRVTSAGTFLVGDTIAPSAAWSGTAVFGKNATNKVIAGYVASSTNGAVIGGHNSALNGWAELNINATNIIFRSNESETMRLTSGGNLGIGTTAPSGKLDLYTNTNAGHLLVVQNPNTGTAQYSEIKVGYNSTRELRLGASYNFASAEWNQAWVYAVARHLALKTEATYDIKFYAGGTADSFERMRITNAGNVGIGVTAPAAKLQVSGSSNVLSVVGSGSLSTSSLFSVDGAFGRLFEVTDDLSNSLFSVNTIAGLPVIEAFADYSVNLGTYSAASGSTMRITGSSVGIGTTNPIGKLEVFSSSDNQLRLDASGTYSSMYLTQNQTVKGALWINYGTLGMFLGTTVSNGYLVLGSNNTIERVRITAAGDVGIGTTSPGGKLDLAFTSAQGATAFILRTTDSSAGNGTIRWRDSANNNEAGIGSSFNVGDPGALEFLNGSTTNMILRSTGNLGLGLTAPDARLTVSASSGDLATFYTGATKRLTITTGGELSFNTSFALGLVWSPASLRFEGQTLGITARPYASNYVSFTVAGATGQTANLQTWQSQAGTVYSVVGATGNVGIGTTAPSRILHVLSSVWDNTAGAGVMFENSNTVGAGLTLKPNASVVTNGSSGWAIYAGGPGAAIGDGNLGFWAHGTNQSMLTIQRGGNVGIGTTAPGYKLSVIGGIVATGATTTQLAFLGADGSNVAYVGSLTNHNFQIRVNNTARVTIDTGGNVGIGTTAPIADLQIRSNWTANPGGGNTVYLSSTGFATTNVAPEMIVTSDNASTTPGGVIGLALHNANVTAGAFAPLLVFSKTETGSSPYNASIAAIGARTVTGTGAGNAWIDGDLMFYTAPTAGSGLVERMRIIQDGNVGIASTTPGAKLDVVGNVRAQSFTGSLQGTASYATQALSASYAPGGASQWTTTGNNIYYTTGNVGIGTSTIGRKLDVYGDGTVARLQSPTANQFVELEFSASGVGPAYIFKNSSGYLPYGGTGSLNIYNTGNIGFHSETTTHIMTLLRTGLVGIGSNAPGAKLDVASGHIKISDSFSYYWGTGTTSINGSSASNFIDLYTNSSARVRIDSNGSVGIGTTSPVTKLEVVGDLATNGGNIRVNLGTATADSYIDVGANRSGNGYSYIDLIGDATYTDYGLRFIRGNSGANTNSAINHRGTGPLQIISVDAGSIELYTSNTVRATITSAGNVGIGSTAPGAKLDVVGDGRFSARVQIQGSNGAGTTQGGLWINYNANASSRSWLINNDYNVFGDFAILQSTTQTGNTFTDRIYIKNDGNVGINTTSPTYKLHVSGGNAFFDGIIAGLDTTYGAPYRVIGFNSTSDGGNRILASSTTSDGMYFMAATGRGFNFRANGGVTNHITISQAGRLGIGTTSPTVPLEVIGVTRIITPTTGLQVYTSGSDFTQGVRVGDLSVDNGYMYLAYISSSRVGSIQAGDSLAYRNLALNPIAGSVGIGTTDPAQKLHLSGDGVRLRLATATNPSVYYFDIESNYNSASTINFYGAGGTNFLRWVYNTAETLLNIGGGNVGVGTTSTTAKLHVQGTTVISGSLGLSGSAVGLPEHMIIALSDETTNITTGTGKVTMRAPFAMRLTDLPRASLSTASTSGLVTVDINENGTSVLGANKLSIDANELTSTTAATQTTIADALIADDAQIRFDIDGAGTGARGLKVTLYYIRI